MICDCLTYNDFRLVSLLRPCRTTLGVWPFIHLAFCLNPRSSALWLLLSEPEDKGQSWFHLLLESILCYFILIKTFFCLFVKQGANGHVVHTLYVRFDHIKNEQHLAKTWNLKRKWITCLLLPFTDWPPGTVDAAAAFSHQAVSGTDEIRFTKDITS